LQILICLVKLFASIFLSLIIVLCYHFFLYHFLVNKDEYISNDDEEEDCIQLLQLAWRLRMHWRPACVVFLSIVRYFFGMPHCAGLHKHVFSGLM